MINIPISAVNLTTILESIGLSKLSWSILHIWATSKQGSDLDMLELEKKTKEAFGYQLNWVDLVSLSRRLSQVNDCTIVGVNSTELLPDRAAPLDELKASCDVVIEAVDSTDWEIFVKDVSLTNKLTKTIKESATLGQ